MAHREAAASPGFRPDRLPTGLRRVASGDSLSGVDSPLAQAAAAGLDVSAGGATPPVARPEVVVSPFARDGAGIELGGAPAGVAGDAVKINFFAADVTAPTLAGGEPDAPGTLVAATADKPKPVSSPARRSTDSGSQATSGGRRSVEAEEQKQAEVRGGKGARKGRAPGAPVMRPAAATKRLSRRL